MKSFTTQQRSVVGRCAMALLWIIGSLLASCSIDTACGQDPGQTPPLTVLSYNIHHAEGTDGKLDLERIAEVIRRAAPDVVALQEVDRHTDRSRQQDQIQRLSELTELNFAYSQTIVFQGGQYGNAVLCRYPTEVKFDIQLPNTLEREQRSALVVEFNWPPGSDQSVWFCATHWDAGSATDDREASAERLVEIARAHPEQPMVLAGDLNTQRGSRAFALLSDDWTATSDQDMPTIPVDRPSRQIDFVLVRPAPRWKLLSTRVLDESVASDHRPLLAQVIFASEPPRREAGDAQLRDR